MEIKNINTKKLYYASNKLSTVESRIYAEGLSQKLNSRRLEQTAKRKWHRIKTEPIC